MEAADGRGNWSGTLGFVLAAMGSAVGLGNIWRFPYTAGENGGGAFVLVYVACVAAVGLPLMLAEVLIGRGTQRNPVGAFGALRPGSAWPLVGWLGVAAGFSLLSYYSVVGGWVLHYVVLSGMGSFAGESPDAIGGLFDALTQSNAQQVFWHAGFMGLTIWFVSGGVRGGIEAANRVMMPALFLLMIFLLVYALTTGGAARGLDFLMTPDWSKIGPHAVLTALGQAFFSLSVGMGTMITYGSYLRREASLPRCAVTVCACDTGVALLAGFMIFPLVFAFQLQPDAGPALIFKTLPVAFGRLPFGSALAVLFFLLLTFAALSSAISLLEVVVAYFVDERGWSRAAASWLVGGAIFAVGVPSALNGGFFDFVDMLTANYMLPTGGLLVTLFAGWALTHAERRDEVPDGDLRSGPYRAWVFLLRFVAPIGVGVILLQSLGLV